MAIPVFWRKTKQPAGVPGAEEYNPQRVISSDSMMVCSFADTVPSEISNVNINPPEQETGI